MNSSEFPHSEISGSKDVCSSPKLIAAYHVLLRLREPRHPPFALAYFFIFLALSYSCIFIQNTIIYRYITASLYTLLFSLVQYVKDLIHVTVQC